MPMPDTDIFACKPLGSLMIVKDSSATPLVMSLISV